MMKVKPVKINKETFVHTQIMQKVTEKILRDKYDSPIFIFPHTVDYIVVSNNENTPKFDWIKINDEYVHVRWESTVFTGGVQV